jgi:DNA polymerase-3 subunit epsilon
LLDARILADVYLAMTGGQNSLALDEVVRNVGALQVGTVVAIEPMALRVVAADGEEQAAHDEFMKLVQKASGGKVLWQ